MLTASYRDEEIEMIYNAIQHYAEVSLVDHRFILATILQEVRSIIPCTLKDTTNIRDLDPGLRQSQGDYLLRRCRQSRSHAIARRHRVQLTPRQPIHLRHGTRRHTRNRNRRRPHTEPHLLRRRLHRLQRLQQRYHPSEWQLE